MPCNRRKYPDTPHQSARNTTDRQHRRRGWCNPLVYVPFPQDLLGLGSFSSISSSTPKASYSYVLVMAPVRFVRAITSPCQLNNQFIPPQFAGENLSRLQKFNCVLRIPVFDGVIICGHTVMVFVIFIY